MSEDTGVRAADVVSLTSALVEANDQLLALYDLAHVTSNTLDERRAAVEILTRSSRILSADAMVLTTAADVFGIGTHTERERLSAITSGRSDAVGDGAIVVAATHASGLEAELRVLRRGAVFSTGDRKMLSAVLRTALGAISTARLHQQVLNRALDSRDLERAAEIAQLALPSWRPEMPGLELFVAAEPARETGGDLYCFATDGNDLAFAVGDVSGKGLTAAVMMTTAICAAKAAFRDPAKLDPAQQLTMISDWTYEHLSDAGLFITLFVGRYEADRGMLHWANAGHSPCALSHAGDWTELTAQIPPIGVFADISARTESVQLEVGDLLAIGSDGIVEQENNDGEPFGDHGMRTALDARPRPPLNDLGPMLFDAVDRFSGGRPPIDDRTILLLRRTT